MSKSCLVFGERLAGVRKANRNAGTRTTRSTNTSNSSMVSRANMVEAMARGRASGRHTVKR